MNQRVTYIFSWMHRTVSSRIFLLVFHCVVALCGYLLIIRDNRFVNGDLALNGLMIKDVLSGKFYSWYFYGQIYYGNLLIFIQSIPMALTGVTIKSLYFWDYFAYALATLLYLNHVKIKSVWFSIAFTMISLFFGRHLLYTYTVQGFSFIVLIIIMFLIGFRTMMQGGLKSLSPLLFFVSLSLGLSLWHNALYIFVFPIGILMYLYTVFIKKIYPITWYQICSFIGGLMVGFVPLFFGTLEKNGQNVLFFIQNTSGSKAESAMYLLRDMVFFIFPQSFFDLYIARYGDIGLFQFVRTFLRADIIDFTPYIPYVLVLCGGAIVWAYALIHIKKTPFLLVNISFIACAALLSITKEASITQSVFANIRYSIALYTIILFTLVEIAYYINSSMIPHYEGMRYGRQCVIAASISVIVFLTAVSGAHVVFRYTAAYQGPQYNELVYEELMQRNVRYLYCFDYFQICSYLAFVGYETLNVEILENPNRNPRSMRTVTDAYEAGKPVYSLIRKHQIPQNATPLNEFRMTPLAEPYYLIEGKPEF